jgi:hypothetical protein
VKLRRALVFAALVVCIALVADMVVWRIVRAELTPDYTMFWTAGRFALEGRNPYDVVALTNAQAWIRETSGPLPFPYPPSALLFVGVFALLPFWPSFCIWTAAGVGAFWFAARQYVSASAILLGLVTSTSLFGLIQGQTPFWTGAALLGAVALLDKRPVVAGALLGAAAALKPQMFMLAPLAIVAAGQWRALIASAVAFSALVALSLPLGLWPEWSAMVQGFQEIVSNYGYIEREGATPAMLAAEIGIDSRLPQLLGIAMGAGLVWLAFRRHDMSTRAVVLICGTLLASPYAVRYEIAALAPLAMAGLLSGTVRGALLALPLFAINVFVAVPAVAIAALSQVLKRDAVPLDDPQLDGASVGRGRHRWKIAR